MSELLYSKKWYAHARSKVFFFVFFFCRFLKNRKPFFSVEFSVSEKIETDNRLGFFGFVFFPVSYGNSAYISVCKPRYVP